jgi:TolA protein
MTATYRPLLARTTGDGELGWTIGVSALAHAAGIAALALLPTRLPGPRALESYTVDLVAPAALGGTNLVPGRPKERAEPALPAQPKAASPSAEVRVPEPKAVAPEPAPPVAQPRQTEAEAKQPEEKPKAEAAPPEPEPEKPQVEPAAKAPEPAKPEPKAAPPEAKQPALAPAAKPAAPLKQPPKAEEPEQAKPQPKAVAKKALAAAKPVDEPKAAAAKNPAAKAKPETSSPLDRRIAEAVQRRAEQMKKEGSAAPGSSDVDRRIAAAVERRVRNVQESGSEGGGPISYGPGSGSGGVVRGVAYILYRGHMEERIKSAWAWAGANRSLRAVVRFNILTNGDIVNVQIVTSSGDPSYDSSIERALRAASPLDPPPAEYREEFSTVELEFRPEDLRS